MISNQILQNTIDGLKSIARIDFCVMDTEGKVLATTFAEPTHYEVEVASFADSPADSQMVQGIQFFMMFRYKLCIEKDQHDLGKLRWLKLHTANDKPSCCIIDFLTKNQYH